MATLVHRPIEGKMGAESRPSLAILITYYNEGELLTRCLNTLLAQTDSPDEIIIYDDASRIAPEPFVPPGLKVRIIHGNTNRGISVGRNVMARTATSEWVHFHDSDDLFHPEFCAHVRAAVAAPAMDAVFSEVASYRDDRLVSNQVIGLETLVRGYDFVRFNIEGVMLAAAATYRKASVLAIGGYRETLLHSEDYDFGVRLAASGIRYKILLEPLVIKLLRSESYSQNQVAAAAGMAESIRMLATEIPSQYHPDLVERLAGIGVNFYKQGETARARWVFGLVNELGTPRFIYQRAPYRVLARTIGPENAERLSAIYRRVLPESVRKLVVASGW